ncbi:MAG: glycosyltransferase, partial [Acidimicrobiales bacterium]|nr:glycosyltransferase [Acidimicrobiales bacterium]
MSAGRTVESESLRVLTVGNMYPPHHRGGYELVWESAVAHLEAQGHTVRVLTTDHREPQPPADAFDHAARELHWYWHEDAWPDLSPLERLRLERHNRRILCREIADLRPDVVCWWAMGGMSLSMIETVRRLGVAEAFVLCDDWLVYGPRVDGWMRALDRIGPLRRVIELATRVPAQIRRARPGPSLCPSRWLLGRAHAAGWDFTESTVVGQGVPRSLFPEAPPRPWRWKIACVGRLDERKGVDLAIGALAYLPEEARLTIIGSAGDEAYRTELDRLIETTGVGDRVEFTSLPRDELGDAYADADVVVFPVRWPEPW